MTRLHIVFVDVVPARLVLLPAFAQRFARGFVGRHDFQDAFAGAVESRVSQVDHQRARGRVDIRRGDLENLPLESGELDVAMLSLVLHYSPEPPRALAEIGRVVRAKGRVLVVDMLPHDREEYQQQMGHVWLGFSEGQITRLLAGAGFERVRVRMLPVDPDAKGPALFAAMAVKQ